MAESSEVLESPVPNPNVTRLLMLAAEHRARGVGWKAIAKSLRRSVTAWEQWLRDYPDVWERVLRSAEGRVFREAGAESLQFLRGLLRSKDEKIVRDVGRTLTTLMYRLPRDRMPEVPSASDDAIELFQEMEKMTDEDIDAIAEVGAEATERRSEDGPAAEADTPSPA